MNYLIVVVLVLLSGLFSGLTLGLLSLDKNELERKISLGNKDAKKVYAVRKKGNLLLCTLLLGNVATNSTLAIFLGNIVSGVAAGFIATALIVILGEIVPQASFARYALEIGSKTAWLVKVFVVLFLPVTWPIAWVLDKTLGEEMPSIYSKKELIKIVQEHGDSDISDVDADEERIIEGALSFSEKKATEVMTPRPVLYALELNSKLNRKLLNEIKKEGFTRIPVYREVIDNVVGILYVKDLINIKIGTKIKDVFRKSKLVTVSPSKRLDHLFNMLIRTKIHLAFIKDEYGVLLGVVSLEDIIEEIINREIVDESDSIADLQVKARKKLK